MQEKNSQKTCHKYDASFKQEDVNMIASGRSVPEIAQQEIEFMDYFTHPLY